MVFLLSLGSNPENEMVEFLIRRQVCGFGVYVGHFAAPFAFSYFGAHSS
jgi:hypothetical protein